MAANSGNIELVSLADVHSHPQCGHGPTLLFERFDQSKGASRKFYACSAFRDRKSCGYFRWADSQPAQTHTNNKAEVTCTHRQSRQRYHKFRKIPKKDRHVCCSCGLLLLEDELKVHESEGHIIRKKIGLRLIRQPSTLFSPLDDNKTYAQYLFSKTSVDLVLATLRQLNYNHILCVGTPRIHEAVQCNRREKDMSLNSVLLDLDERYAQIYPASKFAKYNMFNNYFFEVAGQERCYQFLAEAKDKCVLVTDPPFGGMVDALVKSFQSLSEKWKEGQNNVPLKGSGKVDEQHIPILWFFPYFMENRIISQMPGLVMLDYKVDYENHALYKKGVKQKGSPVRMFTNISPGLITLPADEGYWYCSVCKRYSSKENWHCTDCGACTSKDGTRYVHCDACMRCVKSSRIHCYTCQICELKDHVCGKKQKAGCHICGDLGHKRRDCPHKEEQQTKEKSSRKRKQPSKDMKLKNKKIKVV